MRLALAIAVAALTAACSPDSGVSASHASQSARANAKSSLATNLHYVADWSLEWPFVDAFRSSRSWISGTVTTWHDKRALDTDAQGWVRSLQPGQVARTVMLWDLNGRYPAGQYVVLYEGEGTLQYAGAASLAKSGPGRQVVQVDPSRGGIVLLVTATNPANPVRNIRVLMPGGICEGDPYTHAADAAACAGAGAFKSFEAAHASIVFHPKFLERIRNYRAIRFMDWGSTNNSAQSAWANRPKLSDARWSEKGVPVEVMLQLANLIGADAWFNIPHQADNHYVGEYAKLVAQGLRPDLKAYVEYSNEVWNGIFSQATYAKSRGLALGLSSKPYEAQLRFYSKRAVEIFDIWSAQFADPQRLVRVMASHVSNTWTSETVLDYQNARQKTDALAIAPYFGGEFGTPAHARKGQTPTLDELFTQLETVALPAVVRAMKAHAALAKARGLPLIAYEGGQHLTGVLGMENNAALNALFDAANRDPRMGELYTAYLNGWKSAGGTLMVHFINCGGYSKWGRYGALEYLEQPRAASPKFNALQTFMERNPPWWDRPA